MAQDGTGSGNGGAPNGTRGSIMNNAKLSDGLITYLIVWLSLNVSAYMAYSIVEWVNFHNSATEGPAQAAFGALIAVGGALLGYMGRHLQS